MLRSYAYLIPFSCFLMPLYDTAIIHRKPLTFPFFSKIKLKKLDPLSLIVSYFHYQCFKINK